MRVPLEIHANLRNVRRLFRGPGTAEETACETEILCPEETAELSSAIFLHGQLDKITGTSAETNVPAQVNALTRVKVTHAATIAYHIRNAVLLDGSIYSGRWKSFLSDTPPHFSKCAPIHLETAALASTTAGTKYFGHWLKDDCLQYLLAETYCQPLSVKKNRDTPHTIQYERYFSQDWTPTDRARIDHLIVFQDYAQNSLKRRRHLLLNSKIRSQLSRSTSPPLVYLRRGKTGTERLIQNEDELHDALSKQGFEVVDVSSDDLEYVIASLMNAKIVVSIEGSHISHCWFSPESASGLITLQPPDRFTAIHRGWVECMSARFGVVVGDKAAAGTYFSPSDVLKTVDLMASKT